MIALPLGRLVIPGASLYGWLMFGHVLAAMLWLGGWAILGILAIQALRQGDLASLARFAAAIRFIGPRLLAPATILVAGLGVWLVLGDRQWHFGQLWIALAIGLLLAVLVVGAAFQSRAANGAERAIREDKLDQATRHVRHWAWGSMLILLLLTAADLGHDHQTLTKEEKRRNNASSLPTGNLKGEDHETTISLILDHSAPGQGPRLHKHPYDETSVVIDGNLTFQAGDQQLEPGPETS